MDPQEMSAKVEKAIGSKNFDQHNDSVSVSDEGSVAFLMYSSPGRLLDAVEQLRKKLGYKLIGGIQPASMSSRRIAQTYCATLTCPIIKDQCE